MELATVGCGGEAVCCYYASSCMAGKTGGCTTKEHVGWSIVCGGRSSDLVGTGSAPEQHWCRNPTYLPRARYYWRV